MAEVSAVYIMLSKVCRKVMQVLGVFEKEEKAFLCTLISVISRRFYCHRSPVSSQHANVRSANLLPYFGWDKYVF